MSGEPGFGVYVHWPFCAAKCPYCDFNSHVRHGGVDEARFRAALLGELRTMAGRQQSMPVTTVFFGGGTPSLMAPQTVEAVIDEIARLWPMAADVEITLEANPGSVEAERFRGYRAAGVNRASLGVQALGDEDLRRLGRIHTVAEARAALDTAFATFDRVSFDLIYARPGQSVEAWEAELGQALAIGPSHLSLYQLTIEDGTPFAALHAAGRLITPPDSEAVELYEATQALCAAERLPAYEISNHARPGQECRHNLVYWRYQPYLGVGPGAHGRPLLDGGRRATATERNPERWAARVEAEGHGLIEDQPLSPREEADERLIMGLRLAEGLDLGGLAAATGFVVKPGGLDDLIDAGLCRLNANGDRLTPTDDGFRVLNRLVFEVSERLVPLRPAQNSAVAKPLGAGSST